jgi:hypothetical protein
MEGTRRITSCKREMERSSLPTGVHIFSHPASGLCSLAAWKHALVKDRVRPLKDVCVRGACHQRISYIVV